MKCYCISGLGADKRVFKDLDFGLPLIHIEWITPKANESLKSYSKRLSKQINNSEPFVLLGLSFGGLIACEISQILNPVQTILISSLTSKSDLSLLFRLIGKIRLHRIIPSYFMRPPMFLAYWFFGISQNDCKKLLKNIIGDTDLHFFKWSIDKLLRTKFIPTPSKLLRIHGTKDRLIPATEAQNTHWIKDGGHFMIIQKSEEINNIISKAIQLPSFVFSYKD